MSDRIVAMPARDPHGPAVREPPAIDAGLARSLGLFDVVMMSAGSAMGIAIFAVLSPAVRLAGSAATLGILIAAVPVLVLALTYAYMASVRPRTFSSYEWPREFISPGFAFMVGWINILISGLNIVLQTFVLVQFVSVAVAVPATPVRLAAITVVLLLNLSGVRLAARVQALIMTALLVCLAVYGATAAPLVRLAAFGPLFPHGALAGIMAAFAATPILVNLYLGVECVAEVGGEIRTPHRTLPLGLVTALGLITLFYLGLAIVTLGVLGPAGVAQSATPFVEVAHRALGPTGRAFLVAVPMLSISKSLNISFLCFSRALFAMGGRGVLPSYLAKVERRRHTPINAMLTAYVVVIAGIMVPGGLTFLLLATTLPMLMSYGSCAACAFVASRRDDPTLRSPFIRSRRTVAGLAGLGLASVVLLLAISAVGPLHAHAAVGIWLGLGLLYWFAIGRRAAGDVAE